jgi:hypothetical protein
VHKQRIWIASLAAFGLLTPFLPWVNLMNLIGVSGTEVGQGWLVFPVFAIAAILALTGARAYALDSGRRGGIAVLGVAAMGFGIWKIIEIHKGTIEVAGEVGKQLKNAGEGGEALGRGMLKMFGGEVLTMGFVVFCVVAAGLALVVAILVTKPRANS